MSFEITRTFSISVEVKLGHPKIPTLDLVGNLANIHTMWAANPKQD